MEDPSSGQEWEHTLYSQFPGRRPSNIPLHNDSSNNYDSASSSTSGHESASSHDSPIPESDPGRHTARETQGTTHAGSRNVSNGSAAASNTLTELHADASIWEALASKMLSQDEEKVKDAIEDLGNIILPSGILSVVSAVLLAESSRRLSPNTSAQTLATMQEIATLQAALYELIAAGVKLHVGSSQATDPVCMRASRSSTSLPSGYTINAHAFLSTSLICSIIATSFSLLLRQWLREYFNIHNISPEARLRLRRTKYTELLQWHVFRIAGILPFLQQLSFALFFLGLCCYTASTPQYSGYASYVLVAGWVSCSFVSLFLPALFPRCPYSTEALKPLLVEAHIRTIHAAERILEAMRRWHKTGGEYKTLRDRTLEWVDPLRVTLESYLAESEHPKTVMVDYTDIGALLDAEALQGEPIDDVLGSTILSWLQDIQPSWHKVVTFVLRVLESRLSLPSGELISKETRPSPLDLSKLTYTGQIAIINILSHFAATGILKDVQSNEAVAKWERSWEDMSALYIFFSPSPYPLPERGLEIVKEILHRQQTPLTRLLARNCPRLADLGQDNFHLLTAAYSDIFETLDMPLDISLMHFNTLIGTRFADTQLSSAIMVDVEYPNGNFDVRNLKAWPWARIMCVKSRVHAANFLISAVRRALRHNSWRTPQENASGPFAGIGTPSPERAPGNDIDDALIGMWNMAYIACIESSAPELIVKVRAALNECLITQSTTLSLLKAFGRVEATMIVNCQTKWDPKPFGPWILDGDSAQKLDNLIFAVAQLSDTIPEGLEDERLDRSSTNNFSTSHAFVICYVALHMIEHDKATSDASRWKTLFWALTRLGQKSHPPPNRSQESRELVGVAETCLDMVRNYEEQGLTFFEDDFLLMLAEVAIMDGVNSRWI